MEFDRFFKNRYMFAIYDDNDVIVDVCDNAKELAALTKHKLKQRYVWQMSPSRKNIEAEGMVRIGNYNVYLIDIFPAREKDCFTFEDEEFVRKVVKHRAMTTKQVAAKYHLSRRKAESIKNEERDEYLKYRQNGCRCPQMEL